MYVGPEYVGQDVQGMVDYQQAKYQSIADWTRELSHEAHVSQLEGVAYIGIFALLRRIFSGGIEFRYGR